MLRPYNLLETVLIDVEKGIRAGINVDILAKKYSLSYRHLQRIFKSAFKQTLADYIRSRKLASSLDDLLKTNLKLFDIALEYGFGYEQTYIRAFKREYGITPGHLRKSCYASYEKSSLRFHLRKINNMETNILNVIYNDYFETYSLDYIQGIC
jgi:transcriptional regulator GlxA family with amidase domain